MFRKCEPSRQRDQWLKCITTGNPLLQRRDGKDEENSNKESKADQRST